MSSARWSLTNRGNESTLTELKQLYSLSEYFVRTSFDGLVFHGIPINEQSIVVTYGDCSWANARSTGAGKAFSGVSRHQKL